MFCLGVGVGRGRFSFFCSRTSIASNDKAVDVASLEPRGTSSPMMENHIGKDNGQLSGNWDYVRVYRDWCFPKFRVPAPMFTASKGSNCYKVSFISHELS